MLILSVKGYFSLFTGRSFFHCFGRLILFYRPLPCFKILRLHFNTFATNFVLFLLEFLYESFLILPSVKENFCRNLKNDMARDRLFFLPADPHITKGYQLFLKRFGAFPRDLYLLAFQNVMLLFL